MCLQLFVYFSCLYVCAYLLVSYYLSLFKSYLYLQCDIPILKRATVTYTISPTRISDYTQMLWASVCTMFTEHNYYADAYNKS